MDAIVAIRPMVAMVAIVAELWRRVIISANCRITSPISQQVQMAANSNPELGLAIPVKKYITILWAKVGRNGVKISIISVV